MAKTCEVSGPRRGPKGFQIPETLLDVNFARNQGAEFIPMQDWLHILPFFLAAKPVKMQSCMTEGGFANQSLMLDKKETMAFVFVALEPDKEKCTNSYQSPTCLRHILLRCAKCGSILQRFFSADLQWSPQGARWEPFRARPCATATFT